MIPYVVYTHTDYLEIVNVQTYYLKNQKTKILLINKNNLNLDSLYNQYSKVIFYDDALPYASRLLALKDLDLDFILFIHDIDVVIKQDQEVLDNLLQMAKSDNIDRIDLQQDPTPEINSNTQRIKIREDLCLIKQENPNNYNYNVNPSIWNLATFLEVMTKFSNETYRSIEIGAIQSYMTEFKVYKLYSEPYLQCGYFKCTPYFTFLHLTHCGKFLPKNNNNLELFLETEYNLIHSNFLQNTSREFN